MSDHVHRVRRTTDIAFWLQIPEVMIAARNERSRWLDIKCTHWSPLGMTMSEAYMFRVSMPKADELKYNIRFQWDEGTDQTLGVAVDDHESDRTIGRAELNLQTAQAVIGVFMEDNDVIHYKKHWKEAEHIHGKRPQLTNSINYLMAMLEMDITNVLEQQSLTQAINVGQVTNTHKQTANILTPIRDYMDTIFSSIAGGVNHIVNPETPAKYIRTIATGQQSLFDEVAESSRESHLIYQNWIYANLRYQLRESLQIIYRNHTEQNG